MIVTFFIGFRWHDFVSKRFVQRRTFDFRRHASVDERAGQSDGEIDERIAAQRSAMLDVVEFMQSSVS